MSRHIVILATIGLAVSLVGAVQAQKAKPGGGGLLSSYHEIWLRHGRERSSITRSGT